MVVRISATSRYAIDLLSPHAAARLLERLAATSLKRKCTVHYDKNNHTSLYSMTHRYW